MRKNIEINKTKEKVLNPIKDKIKELPIGDFKVIFVNENGEYVDEIFVSKDTNKIIKRQLGFTRKVVEPYSSITKSELYEKYFGDLPKVDKSYILDLLPKIDAYGRIKYGKAYTQYCREFTDIAKALNVPYETLRKGFIPRLTKKDIVRVIPIKRSWGTEQFISFNPALITGGGYYDRWQVLIWYDIILKYNLLSLKDIQDIVGFSDGEIKDIVEKFKINS